MCSLVVLSAWTQTSITHLDFTPTLGETVYSQSSQESPQNNYELNGQGVSWDMTWFSPSSQDSFRYVSTSNAVNPLHAPEADFVKQSSNGDHFIALNDSAYVSLHYHSYLYDAFEYNYNLIYNLPITYGNIDTTYYTGGLNLAGTITYREVEHIQEVVGEGNLTTPNGYFENCLKVKTVRNYRDSSSATQQITYSADTNYSWHKEGFSEVLFSINITYSNATQQYYYYNYMPTFGMLSTEENYWDQISIAPNPSNGKMEIKNITANSTLIITNSVGQKIENIQLSKGSNYLDLEHLPQGVYYLQLENQNSGKGYKLILY